MNQEAELAARIVGLTQGVDSDPDQAVDGDIASVPAGRPSAFGFKVNAHNASEQDQT